MPIFNVKVYDNTGETQYFDGDTSATGGGLVVTTTGFSGLMPDGAMTASNGAVYDENNSTLILPITISGFANAANASAPKYAIGDSPEINVGENRFYAIAAGGGGGSMSKSVDLITLTGWASLSDGTHTITIKAKADGYRDSEASAGVEVTKGEQTTTLEAGTYQFIEKPNLSVDTGTSTTENTVKANTLTDDNVYGDMSYVYDIYVNKYFEELYIDTEDNQLKYQAGESYDRWLYGNKTATDTSKLRTIIIETDQQVPQSFYDWAITQGNLVKQSTGETWVLNESVNGLTLETTNVSFSSNNVTFTWINTRKGFIAYSNAEEWNDDNIVYDTANWTNNAYRTVTFSTAPTGDLLTWLQANGTKQGGVTLISFTIQDAYGNQTICKAESGMTWEQWINTSYNTLGMKLSASGYVNFPNGDSLRNGSSDVLGTDTIDSKFLYLDPAAQ